MATILIPTPLRKFTNNLSKIEVCGGTVADSLNQLINCYPDLTHFLLDENGILNDRMHVFINDEETPIRNGSDATIPKEAVLNIVPAIKGSN